MRHLISIVAILVLCVASAMSQGYIKKYGAPYYKQSRANAYFISADTVVLPSSRTVLAGQPVTITATQDSANSTASCWISFSRTDTANAVLLIPNNPAAVRWFQMYGFERYFIKSTVAGHLVGVSIE
jgi:hypothetical protein